MATSCRRRPTLRDVVLAGGVAPSTVSNALAYKDIVRPETKQLIRKVAFDLGYRVSPLASGLRTGKTWSIAMIVSDITNPFHGEVVRGAEETLTALDYHRSEEHTSELQSLMRISYAVLCLKTKKHKNIQS